MVPRGIAESAAKTLSYWSTGNGDDTMVTLWNPADEAQDFIFTLFYSGGHYGFPVHLGPKAMQTLNVSEVIHAQIVDSEGNVVPADVHEGSAEISGPRGESEHILVVMDAGTYNVQKAICGVYCVTCSGLVSGGIVGASFEVLVGGTAGLTYAEQLDSGYQIDRTGQVSWHSSDTSIATVNVGTVSGVQSGNVTISVGGGDYTESVYIANYCDFSPVTCPLIPPPASEVDGKVRPAISGANTVWWFSGQAPSGYATYIALTSSGGSGTTWAVTAGSNQITLSTSSGSQTTVTVTGSVVSSSLGDVKVTATANGQSSDPFAITTRRPYRLVPGGFVARCDSQFGYNDFLSYTIQDNLLADIPLSVSVNENWTTPIISDFVGTNWRRQEPPGSFTTDPTAPPSFADQIQGENLALPPHPTPVCIAAGQAVQHWGQEWRIGSTQIGSGTRVQTDTLQKFTQHAEHDSILTGSGVQP